MLGECRLRHLDVLQAETLDALVILDIRFAWVLFRQRFLQPKLALVWTHFLRLNLHTISFLQCSILI